MRAPFDWTVSTVSRVRALAAAARSGSRGTSSSVIPPPGGRPADRRTSDQAPSRHSSRSDGSRLSQPMTATTAAPPASGGSASDVTRGPMPATASCQFVVLAGRLDRAQHEHGGFDRQVGGVLTAQVGIVLDEHVAQGGQALRPGAQEGGGPAAVAGAHLDQRDRIRPAQFRPPAVDRIDQPGHQFAGRRQLGPRYGPRAE